MAAKQLRGWLIPMADANEGVSAVEPMKPGLAEAARALSALCAWTIPGLYKRSAMFYRVFSTMASATEIGPFFAALRHAPIELPEELLTMVLLLLRDLRRKSGPFSRRCVTRRLSCPRNCSPWSCCSYGTCDGNRALFRGAASRAD
jgi:hypothetical protein